MTTFKDLYKSVKDTPEYLAAGVQMDVALIVESLMDQKDISRTALAKSMGCSKPYITKALRGDANFSLLTLAKLAHALDSELKVQILSRQQNIGLVAHMSKYVKKQANKSWQLDRIASASHGALRNTTLGSKTGHWDESIDLAS